MRDAPNKERKSPGRVEAMLLIAVAAAAILFGMYVFLFERDLGAGLLKAMFGLSGGSTAGG